MSSDKGQPMTRQLDDMNLNAYSLFGSEESLMDTIALREMELHRQPK